MHEPNPGAPTPGTPSTGSTAAAGRTASRGRFAVPGYALAAALVVGGIAGLAESSSAVEVPDPDGGLTLDVSSLPLWEDDLEPGEERYWRISSTVDADVAGELSLRVRSAGMLAERREGLGLEFSRCSRPWTTGTEPRCSTGATEVLREPLADIDPDEFFDLGEFAPEAPRGYFLATLYLPDSVPDELQAQEATIGFGFTALGDDATIVIPTDPDDPTDPSGPGDGDGDGGDDGGNGAGDGDGGTIDPSANGGGLAFTGLTTLPLLALAGGLLLTGAVLRRQRSPRGAASAAASAAASTAPSPSTDRAVDR